MLGYLLPEELNAILQRCKKNRTCVGDEILLELGESHYHLGWFLLQKWHLSPVYQSVLNHFEDADFAGDEKPLINLLSLSQRLSSMLLDDDAVDLDELEILCGKLSLSTAGLARIVDELIENREAVQKLASIMGK